MADRMIVMNGGVAEQIGTPLEVYERPVTVFAAQFIGSPSMNILPAEVKGGQVMLGGAALGASDLPDGPVSLGIRPEHLHPDDAGPLTLEVTLAEPLGANTLLHGTLGATGEAMTAALPGVHMAQNEVGQMRLSVKPEDLHLFDAKSGQRLN